MQGKTFYAFSLAFIAGVFAASFSRTMALYAGGFLLLGGIVVAVVRKKKYLFLICGALIAFSLGAGRMMLAGVAEHPLDAKIGEKVSLSGMICDEPQIKETNIKFCFAAKEGVGEDKILITADRYPEYEYGDMVSVSGKLELPENFETYEGGPTFDYISYLSKDDIRYVIKRTQVKFLGENHANPIAKALFSIKGAFIAAIERLMPEPHASLVGGILLGEKGTLPKEVRDDFRRSGLTHILVLSGSNVSVVAKSLMSALAFLPRAASMWTGAVTIILFAVMTGASATTVRASFMALIFILAGGAGRRYDITRALALAAVIMLVQNPRILAFDIGFQLSFLATLALVLVSPIVNERLQWATERFGFREILSSSIATQIFTLPFILYRMGEISIVSLAPNLLVLPLVPWAMFGGFMVGMVGLVNGFLAMPFAWLTDLLLSYMIAVVHFFSGFSFATTRLSIGEPVLVVVYVLYGWFIWRWRNKNSLQCSAN